MAEEEEGDTILIQPHGYTLGETSAEEGINSVTAGILIRIHVAGTHILSYKSCLSFIILALLVVIPIEWICDVVSLSFISTLAFVHSSFKGPTYSPANTSGSSLLLYFCTKYAVAGIGMTPPFLVLSACNLCLFHGMNPLGGFSAGCFS